MTASGGEEHATGGADGPAPGGGAVLSVRDLTVEFPTDDGVVHAVSGVSFDVRAGEVLGVVGESGSGKSVTSMAILGLLPRSARIRGQVFLDGDELLGKKERQMRPLRGRRIAMVFQDALAALNPVYRVGDQIAEAITSHASVGRRELRERVVDLLDVVGIPNPATRADQFPHEYSGGMRQRAMIAMAIANDPAVLIADEPTTALDVTIQAQVLEVMGRVQERTRTAIVLITHDLGIVAGIADRVMVMYAGRQAEIGSVEQIFYEPRHPYTLGLLASLPRIDRSGEGARLYRIEGQPPSLLRPPAGCAYHPRCAFARVPGPCDEELPLLHPVDAADPAHRAACHFSGDLVGLTPDDLRMRSA
ncbi:MAG: ABC transporter ATP-binding protein [Acidimicrobiia bacterium]|nr:ABC transporter ATP-binding protein [Acidimicrobiia bacterium]